MASSTQVGSQTVSDLSLLPAKATGSSTARTLAEHTRALYHAGDTVVNVKGPPYNAYGDGTHDDTAAIQAAMTAAAASGGTVLYPPGTYNVNTGTTCAIPFRSYVKHRGSGVGVTKIRAVGGTGNIFGDPTPSGAYVFTEISDLEIDGNRSAQSFPVDDSLGNAIRMNQVSYSRFYNLYVHDTVFNALSVYNLSNDNRFQSIRITGVGKSGTPPGAWTMNGIFFEAGSSRNIADSITINGTAQYGIWEGARDADNYDNKVANSLIMSTAADGFRIGDQATANKSYRFTLDNVSVLSAGDIGIRAYHAGTGAIVNLKITGAHVEGCTNRGILLDTPTQNALVSNSIVKNNGSYGLWTAGTGAIISNVQVTGHTTNVNDTGTSTQFTGVAPADGRQGTFTPTVLTGGAAVGRTYSNQQGTYRVNGNRVEFDISIVLSAKGSSVGNLTIGGLPFTSVSSGPFSAGDAHLANVTFTGIPRWLILNSSTALTFYTTASASTSTPMNDTQIANTSEFYITGSYAIPGN